VPEPSNRDKTERMIAGEESTTHKGDSRPCADFGCQKEANVERKLTQHLLDHFASHAGEALVEALVEKG